MSLGGIAIAIGAMVDAAIVMIENAHKHLERAEPGQVARRDPDRGGLRGRAGAVLQPADHHRVVPADLHAGIAGRAAVQPARLHQDVRDGGGGAAVGHAGAGADGDLRARQDRSRAQESDQPLPDLDLSAGDQGRAAGEDAASSCWRSPCSAVTIWPARQLGTEFMPSLNEGTLLYMPTTLPGISVTKAAELMQTQDRIIRSFPEVASVYGKAGRAATATDPAPTEMFETIDQSEAEGAMAARRDRRQPDRRDGQGAAVSRASPTPGPCRSRRASTCCRPASARRSASR